MRELYLNPATPVRVIFIRQKRLAVLLLNSVACAIAAELVVFRGTTLHGVVAASVVGVGFTVLGYV